MATTADDTTFEDSSEAQIVAGDARSDARHARADALWMLFGITLLGAFLAYVLATS